MVTITFCKLEAEVYYNVIKVVKDSLEKIRTLYFYLMTGRLLKKNEKMA